VSTISPLLKVKAYLLIDKCNKILKPMHKVAIKLKLE